MGFSSKTYTVNFHAFAMYAIVETGVYCKSFTILASQFICDAIDNYFNINNIIILKNENNH